MSCYLKMKQDTSNFYKTTADCRNASRFDDIVHYPDRLCCLWLQIILHLVQKYQLRFT